MAEVRGASGAILIVDDEPAVRAVMAALLRSLGHEVLEAPTGFEALCVVRQRRPRLVFMDLVMPGAAGLETIRQIRRIDPELRIVVLSGEVTGGAVADLATWGVTVLRAPLDLTAFQAAIG